MTMGPGSGERSFVGESQQTNKPNLFKESYVSVGFCWFAKKNSTGDFIVYGKLGTIPERTKNTLDQRMGAWLAIAGSAGIPVGLVSATDDACWEAINISPGVQTDTAGRNCPGAKIFIVPADGDPVQLAISMMLNREDLRSFEQAPKQTISSLIDRTKYDSAVTKTTAESKDIKPFSPNEVSAILLYGESAQIGAPDIDQIMNNPHLAPLIETFVSVNTKKELDGHLLKGVAPLCGRTLLINLNSHGCRDARQEFGTRYNSAGCKEFVKMVLTKLGGKEGNFDLLFATVKDQAQRMLVVNAFCEGRLSELKPEHQGSLAWIKSVGTDEEYQVALRATKTK